MLFFCNLTRAISSSLSQTQVGNISAPQTCRALSCSSKDMFWCRTRISDKSEQKNILYIYLRRNCYKTAFIDEAVISDKAFFYKCGRSRDLARQQQLTEDGGLRWSAANDRNPRPSESTGPTDMLRGGRLMALGGIAVDYTDSGPREHVVSTSPNLIRGSIKMACWRRSILREAMSTGS